MLFALLSSYFKTVCNRLSSYQDTPVHTSRLYATDYHLTKTHQFVLQDCMQQTIILPRHTSSYFKTVCNRLSSYHDTPVHTSRLYATDYHLTKTHQFILQDCMQQTIILPRHTSSYFKTVCNRLSSYQDTPVRTSRLYATDYHLTKTHQFILQDCMQQTIILPRHTSSYFKTACNRLSSYQDTPVHTSRLYATDYHLTKTHQFVLQDCMQQTIILPRHTSSYFKTVCNRLSSYQDTPVHTSRLHATDYHLTKTHQFILQDCMQQTIILPRHTSSYFKTVCNRLSSYQDTPVHTSRLYATDYHLTKTHQFILQDCMQQTIILPRHTSSYFKTVCNRLSSYQDTPVHTSRLYATDYHLTKTHQFILQDCMQRTIILPRHTSSYVKTVCNRLSFYHKTPV